MSKFQECMETYKSEFAKLGISYDEDLLTKVAKGCGPSIYNADASKVSSSDADELGTVKKNFVTGKLGVSESEEKMDAAIQSVVDKFGSSNRNKYRAMFYYLLVVHYGKASVYA